MDEEREGVLVHEVFDEVVGLFHRLRFAAEEVHGQGELSAARRGVMKSLAGGGRQTVPQLARARYVSRQYIQKIANGLVSDGLAEFVDNAAHKRSKWLCLTAEGEALLASFLARERATFAGLSFDSTAAELEVALGVLRGFRELLDGPEWEEALRLGREWKEKETKGG